jgi:hypothetical protein
MFTNNYRFEHSANGMKSEFLMLHRWDHKKRGCAYYLYPPKTGRDLHPGPMWHSKHWLAAT